MSAGSACRWRCRATRWPPRAPARSARRRRQPRAGRGARRRAAAPATRPTTRRRTTRWTATASATRWCSPRSGSSARRTPSWARSACTLQVLPQTSLVIIIIISLFSRPTVGGDSPLRPPLSPSSVVPLTSPSHCGPSSLSSFAI